MSDEQKGASAEALTRLNVQVQVERAFVAWLQGGATLISLGLAIAGFLPKVSLSVFPLKDIIGLGLVLQGFFLALIGITRYVQESKQFGIEQRRFAVQEIVASIALWIIVALVAVVYIVVALIL